MCECRNRLIRLSSGAHYDTVVRVPENFDIENAVQAIEDLLHEYLHDDRSKYADSDFVDWIIECKGFIEVDDPVITVVI